MKTQLEWSPKLSSYNVPQRFISGNEIIQLQLHTHRFYYVASCIGTERSYVPSGRLVQEAGFENERKLVRKMSDAFSVPLLLILPIR